MTEFARSASIPHLEVRRSCRENSCYRSHSHDAFSIGVIDSGRSVFAGQLSGSVRLLPGDVIVMPAGYVHRCNPDGGLWVYQMTHMDQAWASECAVERSRSLFSAITVFRRADLRDLVAEWNQSIVDDASAADLESGMREVIAELESAPPEHRVEAVADPVLMSRIRPVLERLRDDDANPSLDELGEIVGMSRFQLVRAVKRATGLAPLAWRQNARIGSARMMLRSGASIVETAHATGFADQSHFHRVFSAHVGATPGAYRG